MRTTWRTVVAGAAVALIAACAGGKAEQKPDKVTQKSMTGSVEFVDSRSIMVSDPQNPDQPARLLSRGEHVSVMQDGQEVGWSELNQGDEVRVAYTERISGPSEIDRVEILSGEAAPQTAPAYPPDTMQPEPVPGQPGQTPSPMPPGAPR